MTDTNTTFTPGTTENSKTFADFGVQPPICEALAEAGIISPFPIQELTLPLALAGADLIGQARTGTGKTLAFGIPLLQRVDAGVKKTQALIVVPTRELCFQVAEDLTRASANLDIEVVALYGGKALEPQAKAVEAGAHVVVGTPGRLLDLLRRGSLTLSGVQALVLDEADEMLDLGFLPDVEQLIQATAEGRQTLLFSATMPSAVVALARRYMHKPTFLRADVEEIHVAPKTKQHFFSCHRMDKPAVLARILTTPNRGLCVVFTRTKRMADVLAEELRERGIKAAPIHSDLRQEAREKALERFRKGTITVLVATEVAARGLDIDDVTHVVNYDCPEDEKMYLHRIGRTGRAGAEGVAITMALWNELARLEMIKKTLDIAEPTHEVFSTSPILDELFNLPPRDQVRRAPVADDDEDDAVAEAKDLLAADAAKTASRDAAKKPPAREAADRADRDDDTEGDGPKRRRRGGRGGRGRGAAAEQTAVADQPAAADAKADSAPARQPARSRASEPVTESAEEGTRTRTRTRTRRVDAETASAETASAETAPAETVNRSRAGAGRKTEDADERAQAREAAETTGPDGERVRVRRRTRTTDGGSRPVEDTTTERQPRQAREPREPRAARSEGGGEGREPSRQRSGESRSSRGQSRGGRAQGGRTQGARAQGDTPTEARGEGRTRGDGGGQAKTQSGRGASESRSRDGRGRDARGRDARGRGRDQDRRRETSDVDVEVARDGARPVISRPLKVEHLP